MKPDPERLNYRCEILLTRNRHAIKDKTVLDLASHDGTFSYACIKLGAKHVVGIEPRANLVHDANENLRSLNCKNSQYNFIQDDMFNYLPTIEPGEFDTILCFGLFYHTKKQTELLELITKCQPTYLILDTFVETLQIPEGELTGLKRKESQGTAGYLVFYYENPELNMATIGPTGLTATPSKSLVEAFLRDYGFTFKQLRMDREEVDDWEGIRDYKTDARVAYIAETIAKVR
jgi:SAM-dependent methyltransferase